MCYYYELVTCMLIKIELFFNKIQPDICFSNNYYLLDLRKDAYNIINSSNHCFSSFLFILETLRIKRWNETILMT